MYELPLINIGGTKKGRHQGGRATILTYNDSGPPKNFEEPHDLGSCKAWVKGLSLDVQTVRQTVFAEARSPRNLAPISQHTDGARRGDWQDGLHAHSPNQGAKYHE